MGEWERLGLISWGSGKVGKMEWFNEKKGILKERFIILERGDSEKNREEKR